MTKKTTLCIIRVSLLVVAMLVTFNSLHQLTTDDPYCTGAMCISNSDCGGGCYCAHGICFSASNN